MRNCKTFYHDSLFKEISPGLMKKEGLSVKKVWAPRVSDALNEISKRNEKPKAILLHACVNDLKYSEPNEIVDIIMDI